ncbi:WD40 repeat domain-containing protein [Streptomyces prunicolor]|uniref:WD40 repeat domain-containing protein n=1 Tax=Streptomyces prunicolor TaxID=67348 RepID=UPI000375F15C|nr:hypothetical protein [Streptomyces prunicolor]
MAALPSGRSTGHDLVQGGQIGALAFGADGSTLAVGGAGDSLQLWAVATQQPLSSAPLTTPGKAITSLAFSPGGSTVYAGSAHVPLQRTYVPDAPDAPYRRVCRAGCLSSGCFSPVRPSPRGRSATPLIH